MTGYLVTMHHGDAQHMTDIPDESVQCIITSPPYWQQRVYDVPDIEIEGWKGQFGMERSPQAYIAHSLIYLREMWRVLKLDGVIFYNIGDKYISAKGTCFSTGGNSFPSKVAKRKEEVYPLDRGNVVEMRSYGLKPKDLALIPFRLALAAQEAGWTIRRDIIWHKRNVAPESVKDRPPTEHEYIFLFAKSPRYQWNYKGFCVPTRRPGELNTITGKKYRQEQSLIPPGDPQDRGGKSQFDGLRRFRTAPERPVRSVWDFATQGYAGKHRSVFPEKLVEICIRLATKEGDTVLDPFAGTGTTLWVAKCLGRRAIGYDLSTKYVEMAGERNAQLTTEEA